MLTTWKSYLAVQMYLAPVDENRVRYLMNLVSERESGGDANTAKNIAVSSAVEQFLPCWLGQKTGTVYLGCVHDYIEFNPRKYDPRNDPIYASEGAPNFQCALIVYDTVREVLFSSSDAFEGTIDEAIIFAIRVQAYRMKYRDRGHPCLWLAKGPDKTPAPLSLIMGKMYLGGDNT